MDELKKELGQNIEVDLIAGSGGVFEVIVDDRLIYSKKQQGQFPDCGEIVRLIG